MRAPTTVVAATVLVAAAGLRAGETVNFYGGDRSEDFLWISVKNDAAGVDQWIYDDFNWDGGTVTSLFGTFYVPGTLLGLTFEIRKDIDADGGTLVNAGTGTITSSDLTGDYSYRLDLDIADFDLEAGTYHLGLQVELGEQADPNFPYAGPWFTDGTNGIGSPLHNMNLWIGYPGFGFGSINGEDQPWDASYGVCGEEAGVIPLPTPAFLATAGLGCVFVRRRR